jgi:hypothetical protein
MDGGLSRRILAGKILEVGQRPPQRGWPLCCVSIGMEEVVGSIPTRSTNPFNNLDAHRPEHHGSFTVAERRASPRYRMDGPYKRYSRCDFQDNFAPVVRRASQHVMRDSGLA